MRPAEPAAIPTHRSLPEARTATRSLPCPFCGSLHSGRYQTNLGRFLCVNTECPRCAEVIDYAPVAAEISRQTQEFFARLPRLAAGTSRPEVEGIAEDLLHRGVEPYRTLELVAAWNEGRAAPPMPRRQLVAVVDQAAARMLAAEAAE